jgi:DNA (cytosine-5)-methyltransferase 1
MVKGYMKQAYLQIIKTLRECGYKARGEILNAMYFNVPQSRERVIIIGVRKDLGIEPSHPKPSSKKISVHDIWPEFSGKVVERRKGRKDVTHKYRPITEPAPTIPKCGGHIEIDGKRARWPHEIAKKIASFPDDFRFVGSISQKAERIGNSVPPNLMRAIAGHIKAKLLKGGSR